MLIAAVGGEALGEADAQPGTGQGGDDVGVSRRKGPAMPRVVIHLTVDRGHRPAGRRGGRSGAPVPRRQCCRGRIFLGNTAGGVRARRYGLLAGLPVGVRIHGQVDDDPAGIAGPFLREHADVVTALTRARLGISLAQRFAAYRGDEHDFPELAALGSFEFPSRAVQYAATGLPVVVMDPSGVSDALPETVVARDRDELASSLKRLLADPDGLVDLGRRTRERFDRRLQA